MSCFLTGSANQVSLAPFSSGRWPAISGPMNVGVLSLSRWVRRGGGSGWVLLSWSPRDRCLVNQWASDHCHTLAGGNPILVLDMYEHSYHIDFGAKAASYVDTFMEAIRRSE